MENEKRLRQRDEIDENYKWKIEKMYADDDEWERDFSGSKQLIEEFKEFSGHLAESADTLLKALQLRDSMWLKLEKVYVYSRMRQDEDNRSGKYQTLNMRAESLMTEASATSSYFIPEILAMDESKIREYISSDTKLEIYTHMIDDLMRLKEHILSEREENLLAQFGEVSGAPRNIFSMINNADIKFGKITDEDGEECEITHGNYIKFMESHDRNVRENAFRTLYAAFEKQRNTLAATYSYSTKKDVMFANIRKYESALDSALKADNIQADVYTNLISSVNNHLGSLHKYMDIRKKRLAVDNLTMYDMYVPLIEMPDSSISYQQALNLMYDALSPLGEQYISDVKNGVEAGWIDVYENEGKTSGAYSFGSFDSMPYILMNFSGKLQDAFTIVHEMGHSMNSFYTRRKQPFIYGGHSIFTAEVASTVNECLLTQHLLKNAKSDDEKLYLLNLYIEGFRTTLFRQTMFAEFEKMTHEAVERGEVLTPDRLCHDYGELNRKYFGENVYYDKEIEMEWSRIPHFYNAFYVYKYATGYSAAVAISNKILNEGAPAVDAYLNFLAGGDSDYPIELLAGAGVDMSKPDVVESAMKTFDDLITQLEKLV